ncbi:2'-5' RNA ligase family protein [Bacillus cytotoxicus]|uniref:2'-5' RNA ligase family protein n=1 Tax=Bacillus cytotoxicus TaxID=580165 RepID=A0ACC6A0D6_9BACI|nr:2'-5' RNA ligase family protein [Bacillus cytotoxicus]
MYGVIALFDEAVEKEIHTVWNELCRNGISYYSKEVPDRRPHITIASYQNFEQESFIEDMNQVLQETSNIPITLSTLGTFLASKTVFLTPIPTKTLLDFHCNFHGQMKKYSDHSSSLYLPDNWIPHCTIANHLTEEKFHEAFRYCTDRIEKIHAVIREIALIKVEHKNEKCVDAPIIFSKRLTNVTNNV